MSDKLRYLLLAITVGAIIGAIVLIERPWEPRSTVDPAPTDIPRELRGLPSAPNFNGASGWINPPGDKPVELSSLRGRVVLVDFWTYSCINCIRTFPYIKAWEELYGPRGLTVIGVHSPEFRFERDKDHVQEAMQHYGLHEPVAIDNNFRIWNAYGNNYWPAKYLVDQYGKIRASYFGEGRYEEVELKIRTLLRDAGYDPGSKFADVTVNGDGGTNDMTPELYAGTSTRPSSIGNAEGYHAGQTFTYTKPQTLSRDKIYLSGTWKDTDEGVVSQGDSGIVYVDFTAGAANFVGDGTNGTCVKVLIDGNDLPSNRAGRDITYNGASACATLRGPASYDVYGGAYEEHVLELRVPNGFALYTFDFSANKTS